MKMANLKIDATNLEIDEAHLQICCSNSDI